MGKQRERDEGVTVKGVLEQIVGGPLPAGTRYSGSQIENFREGWAMDIMRDSRPGKAHYFRRRIDDLSLAVAKCSTVAQVRWLYGPGNYDKCGRCRNAMARRAG